MKKIVIIALIFIIHKQLLPMENYFNDEPCYLINLDYTGNLKLINSEKIHKKDKNKKLKESNHYQVDYIRLESKNTTNQFMIDTAIEEYLNENHFITSFEKRIKIKQFPRELRRKIVQNRLDHGLLLLNNEGQIVKPNK